MELVAIRVFKGSVDGFLETCCYFVLLGPCDGVPRLSFFRGQILLEDCWE